MVNSARTVTSSVVRLECICTDVDSRGNIIQGLSIGSGVIYKTFGINDLGKFEIFRNRKYQNYEYYVLTNRHVINDSKEIKVYIGSYDEYAKAKILGYDDKLDIGIIAFNYDKYLGSVKISKTGIVDKGSFVFTIGNPDGYLDTLTMGVVSYPVRNMSSDTDGDKIIDYVSRYIQIDAAINPGSSGGGLFDSSGKLIGINTMKIVDEKIEGIGFAILIDDVKEIITHLEKGLIPDRIELGITVNDVNKLDSLLDEDKYNYGLIITNIKNDSLAYLIGLELNDIIVEVNGYKIKRVEDLLLSINNITFGSEKQIKISVIRDGEIVTKKYVV